MRCKLISTVLATVLTIACYAQVDIGGAPLLDRLEPLIADQIPNLNVDVQGPNKYFKENEQFPFERIAAPVTVDIDAVNDGETIVLPNGDRITYLNLNVPGVDRILLTFDQFHIAEGSRLFAIDQFGNYHGAYSSVNNNRNEQFTLGFIPGDRCTLELYEPKNAGKSTLHLRKLFYSYFEQSIEKVGFGDSWACEINVNCPQGDDWQDEKKGVVRIMVVLEEGVGFCTGSLINNTTHDGTPYVLSAYHCQDGFTPIYGSWRFDFDYETDGCDNPLTEPSFQSVVGCSQVAGRQESDFLLLELNQNVPSNLNVVFNGWNRRSMGVPSKGTLIHHPQGDIKKITHDDDAAAVFVSQISWNTGVTTPPSHHFRLIFEEGTFELGSSGAPHFDAFGRIVGQLHGGNTNCTDLFNGFTGRLSISWDAGADSSSRLMDWLDPNATGEMFIDGYEPPVDTSTICVSGRVQLEDGRAVNLVELTMNGGGMSQGLITGPDGTFTFCDVPRNGTYTITPSKNIMPGNGLSTIDIVVSRRHLLDIDPFETTCEITAADTDGNGTISTVDFIHLRRMILDKTDEFPNNVPSWVFDPLFITISPSDNQTGVDFKAIKIGDVTNDVDPQK